VIPIGFTELVSALPQPPGSRRARSVGWLCGEVRLVFSGSGGFWVCRFALGDDVSPPLASVQTPKSSLVIRESSRSLPERSSGKYPELATHVLKVNHVPYRGN
jgi:hypothetical protein